MSRAVAVKVIYTRTGQSGERGFALLEILVAFVILAIGLGAISTGIALAMRSDDRTQVGRAVNRLAQARLEAAGVATALLPGRREGRMANYKWQETVTPVRIAAAPQAKAGQATSNAGVTPFWVEIEVQASDGTVGKVAALKLVSKIRP